MTMTSADVIGLLTPGLKTAFFGTFEEMGHQYQDISTLIPSDKDTEHYAWLGALPGVNEFLDERRVGYRDPGTNGIVDHVERDLKEYEYFIKNKTWESTISVDRAAIEDDQYGQLAIRAKQMGASGAQHLDLLTYGMLEGGFVNPCFDGAAFFGPHTQGGITQVNRAGDTLSAASLQAAITAMMRFTDDQGKPAGVTPDLLVVSPELYWEGRVLLESTYYPDLVTTASQELAMNPLKGLLSLTVSPYLASPNNWYLLDTKRVVKAVILQMRKDFEFEALEQNSETGFLKDVFYYGVRARYNAGYGDWRAAFGSAV